MVLWLRLLGRGCLYYSVDYCRVFSGAEMLNGAETTFSALKNGHRSMLD